MDLSSQFPRSPHDMNAGIDMLPRTTDKCRAFVAGTLGDYHYDCPLDQELFGFLGIDADRFRVAVQGLDGDLAGDEEVSAWIANEFPRSAAEKDAFNNEMRHRRPQGAEAEERFAQWQKDLGREDYFSYFDHLDADEGRF